MASDREEPLAELELARHRDLVGRRDHWGRRVVTAVLVVFVLLAAANQFGQQPSTSHVAANAASMTVSTPSRLRQGLIFQTRVDLTATRTLARPSLTLSGGWFDGVTLNSVQPSPASQASAGSGVVFTFPRLSAGRRMSVWFEWSVNPTTVAWQRAEQITLADRAPVLTLHRSVTIFP